MSKRELYLLIEDIWESLEKIERYTEGMTLDNFQDDDKTTDAVVRNFEIIGEAAGRLPKDFINRNLVVLSHAFQKKTQKTPKQAIKIAEERKKEYFRRKNK